MAGSAQDADLILLALVTHEPNLDILREDGSLEEIDALSQADIVSVRIAPITLVRKRRSTRVAPLSFNTIQGCMRIAVAFPP